MIKAIFMYMCNAILTVKEYFRSKDYSIIYTEIEYSVNNNDSKYNGGNHSFWDLESFYWVDGYRVYVTYTNACEVPEIISNIPDNISDLKITHKYNFNGTFYKYISNSSDYNWPPVRVIKFSLPIKNADLLDSNNKVVKDVTNRCKIYAGPNNNFHGISIKSKYIFYENFYKLRIVNLLNQPTYYLPEDYINPHQS